jgi:hypothetical protein
MKQGFQMSDNAMMLLNDAEKSLNRAIDNMRKFAETHSGATAKYQVATTTYERTVPANFRHGHSLSNHRKLDRALAVLTRR